jgi:predicted RNA-binding Zn-ribbon protein involved in translation (DUF1610 family)
MVRSRARRARPRWRIVTYAVIVFNLVMVAWLIVGPAWIGTGCSLVDDTDCQGSSQPGRRVAVPVILALWALGNLVLGGIWIATNNIRRRPCPQCGKNVKDTVFRCPNCGHDFRVGLQPRSGRYEPPGGHA